MVHLLLTPIAVQIAAISIILLIFTCLVFKYLTYTTPNPDAKIKLSDKDPNHKLKGYKRQDLSIHELRNYDGKNGETNYVIFVAVNGFIFDVTIDRNLYGPGGHYFALAGRDASRALSKFSISCDTIPTEDDLMSDFTSAQDAQLNEWYGQFSERYQCVGRLIRCSQERYVYDHSDDDDDEDEIGDDTDDNFDDDIHRYCGIQSDVMTTTTPTTTTTTTTNRLSSVNMMHDEPDSTNTATDQRDCSSDQYNKPLLNELSSSRNKYSKITPSYGAFSEKNLITEDFNSSSSNSELSLLLNRSENKTSSEIECHTNKQRPSTPSPPPPHSGSSSHHSIHNTNNNNSHSDLIKQ